MFWWPAQTTNGFLEGLFQCLLVMAGGAELQGSQRSRRASSSSPPYLQPAGCTNARRTETEKAFPLLTFFCAHRHRIRFIVMVCLVQCRISSFFANFLCWWSSGRRITSRQIMYRKTSQAMSHFVCETMKLSFINFSERRNGHLLKAKQTCVNVL